MLFQAIRLSRAGRRSRAAALVGGAQPRRKEVIEMAKSNKEVTGAKAASAAAKVLSNPKSSPAAKSAAASALTQRPNKKK